MYWYLKCFVLFVVVVVLCIYFVFLCPCVLFYTDFYYIVTVLCVHSYCYSIYSNTAPSSSKKSFNKNISSSSSSLDDSGDDENNKGGCKGQIVVIDYAGTDYDAKIVADWGDDTYAIQYNDPLQKNQKKFSGSVTDVIQGLSIRWNVKSKLDIHPYNSQAPGKLMGTLILHV